MGEPLQWGFARVPGVERRQSAFSMSRMGRERVRSGVEQAREEPEAAAGRGVLGRTGLTCDENRLQEAEIALAILLLNSHALQGHGHVHLQRDSLRYLHESVAVRVPPEAWNP